MDSVPDHWETVLRVLAAVVGAGALGWQRERHGKPAGLRTQMMVALGAAVFTIVTLKLHESLVQAGGSASLDPTRVIQGIVGGIGFLGAGTIIQSRGSVEGVTTAATVWVVGALGIACGLGYLFVAAITVVVAFVLLTVFGIIEHRMKIAKSDDEGGCD